jgi:hypothetical protein
MLGLAEADYSKPGLGDAGLRNSRDLALGIRPTVLLASDAPTDWARERWLWARLALTGRSSDPAC